MQGCQTLLGDCLLNVWKMAAKDLIDVDKQAIINLETGNIRSSRSGQVVQASFEG